MRSKRAPQCNASIHSSSAQIISIVLAAALLLGALALAIAPAQASPQALIFNVDSGLDEVDAAPGDGACASAPSGVCTLRAAVQEANALAGSDTIVLPAGLYTLSRSGRGEDLAATGDLDITASLTIQGAGAAAIIDANAIDRAFQIFGPAVATISGLTIQDGDSGASAGGGGIAVVVGSTLTLEDVALVANTAGDTGGGIYNNGGNLVLRRVRVAGNNALTAAGIRNSGSLTIQDSTIADNHATQAGGGIFNTGAMSLNGVTVSGNIASTNGGGLYLHSADPATGLVTIQNSTISGNQAMAWMGGGIWIYYQTELWLTNCTLASNSAGQGGGIFNYHQQAVQASASRSVPGAIALLGNIHLLNTLVANNTFANCGRSAQTEPIESLGHNLDSANTCEFVPAIGDLVNTPAGLGLLQDNGGPTLTRALLAGSAAINAGDNTGCPATDQRGVSRPQGGTCDIGAYERILTGEANLSLTKVDAVDPVIVGDNIHYTLTVSNLGPDSATSTSLTDNLPAGVSFVSATPSQGNCDHASGVVTCDLSTIANGGSATVQIVVTTNTTGEKVNNAGVSSTTADPSLANNSASASTSVNLGLHLPLIFRY